MANCLAESVNWEQQQQQQQKMSCEPNTTSDDTCCDGFWLLASIKQSKEIKREQYIFTLPHTEQVLSSCNSPEPSSQSGEGLDLTGGALEETVTDRQAQQ